MNRNQQNNRRAQHGTGRGGQASGRNRSAYLYGTAAPRLEVVRQPVEAPARVPRQKIRRNRDKAHHMSAGYVLFLAVALCAAAVILVNYIQLQAQLTGVTRQVATEESRLNSMRIANDEAYSRVINGIDLEEVKRIAIGELGMVYAEEGQIVTYTTESNDYMRQVTESR